jgi:hypothetical protein
VIELGVVLLVAAMALGVLGLVRRGYECLTVLAMAALGILGVAALVKGLLS